MSQIYYEEDYLIYEYLMNLFFKKCWICDVIIIFSPFLLQNISKVLFVFNEDGFKMDRTVISFLFCHIEAANGCLSHCDIIVIQWVWYNQYQEYVLLHH